MSLKPDIVKVLLSDQIREADKFTIENEPIASIDLMERASQAFVNWFKSYFDTAENIAVFCGTGNNGGDGMAISRLLIHLGYSVQTFYISKGNEGSPDFENNKKELDGLIRVQSIDSISDFPDLEFTDIIIDAIFGSGLTRPVEGLYAEVISGINSAHAKVISVDIASGLPCDFPFENIVAVRPYYTISFQLPKLAFFFRENAQYVGEWEIVDIGLDRDFIENQETHFHWVNYSFARVLVSGRERHSHKGNYGHALIISGSKGKMGAAVLAARGCLRSGVGLLTMHCPACGTNILQSSVPEAMVIENAGSDFIKKQEINIEGYSALGIGPGLGQEKETYEFISGLLSEAEIPMVIDADALNIISSHAELLEILPRNSILTPHPKEFSRIAGETRSTPEQYELQMEFSRKYHCYVVLKGGYTSISTPEGSLFFNTHGNPGMATGGAGDVLTGIITGLLAQGYSSQNAAILGVFLHSIAGDEAAEFKTQPGMITSDIIDYLPEAYRLLFT